MRPPHDLIISHDKHCHNKLINHKKMNHKLICSFNHITLFIDLYIWAMLIGA